MKRRNLLLLLIIILIILLLLLLRHCNSGGDTGNKPTIDSPYKIPDYRKDQVVIFFKQPPNAAIISRIKQSMASSGIDTSKITVQKCANCTDMQIELWNAPHMDTYAVSEPVKGGSSSGSGSNGVGEDTALFAPNFIVSTPPEEYPNMPYDSLGRKRAIRFPSKAGADTVKVAILDTGIDDQLMGYQQLFWKNPDETLNNADDDHNCLKDDIYGWNFVDNNNNLRDDSRDGHGTHIALFIINEFQRDQTNALQLMILKTHNSKSEGDMFNILCAMSYAANKGANVINASWGYYSLFKHATPYSQIDSIITAGLAARGILFVTAAGNRMAAPDDSAMKAGITGTNLRNLDLHYFYPACLGGSNNNIIVATTVNDSMVSPTQNFSPFYVDLGVLADEEEGGFLKFKVPYTLGTPQYVSGSSYATAIVTGRIAATCKKNAYTAPLRKSNFLQTAGLDIKGSAKLDQNKQVNGGKYIIHN
ncbi:subtilase family protein [Chitinophaga dinghuensis]|uniref:Subtilase family protein n=1 Tax=Chitinophaga dinghuensis TaxID=1539050 RepID=A0A327WAP2_9BACT|nr:S8 family serine peptidase [Chitinophaga dinghuensis]RAJ87653.1 subtilase family protein [Chitinophaga dinghuensis]